MKNFTTSRLRSNLLGFILISLGMYSCSSEFNEDELLQDDFQRALATLTDEYGDDSKADFSALRDPCDLLEPVLEYGEILFKSGYFVGIEGEGVVSGVIGVAGLDVVWDLYHGQALVSTYQGLGINPTSFLGGTVSTHLGWATGFEQGVWNWNGYHVVTTAEIGLPFLKDYVSFQPALFVEARDANGNGQITFEEILVPPEGVYGYSLGIGIGVELFPDPLPVELSLFEGESRLHARGTKLIYDRLKFDRLIPVIGERLEVSLVDRNGALCTEDWPELEAGRECFLSFGRPEWSHTQRALHTARSICALTDGCVTPLSWNQVAFTIAIGFLRDQRESFTSLCPG